MHWEANALHYGVVREELAARCDGRTVIVNGSRAYLPRAVRLFPELVVAHITADAQTLRRRLLARERETPQMVDARVRRALDFQLPLGIAAIEVRNDATLAQAGAQLQQALKAWNCL
jgi:ribose 1,5-bisphosphokinase